MSRQAQKARLDAYADAELAKAIYDPWSPDCPDPFAGMVEPFKAGWNGDPGTWRLHYRVRPVDLAQTERTAAAARRHLASLSPARRAELERDWHVRSCA